MVKKFVKVFVALCIALSAFAVTGSASAAPAQAPVQAADGCYTWAGPLSEGATGDPVRQLQIRVSGYPGSGEVLGLDGTYGPATKAAVTRFQQAYGISADGVAGDATFAKIYELQDDDCTPANFDYAELNGCNSDWSGGPLSAADAKANALVSMWKLQAMRHALGDVALSVSSGFRSYSCNDAVGGAADSRHLYGDGVDLIGAPSFCTLALQARDHGFSQILGPGYPGHDDHTHVAASPSRLWSAPTCGLG
ncbi:D-Ala-D-Ala carboxypeptidase family metallohydrolase [Amycolatopsis antarctica]|uniref:D-Ala-D-Ala carboxypeptidase family metallohydrolase n=1 Tax=Amycolatopsis antarctica TaxID=1854586 RepID=UPI00268F7630